MRIPSTRSTFETTYSPQTTRNDSIASTDYQDYVDDFSDEILTVNVVIKDLNDNAPVFERATDTTGMRVGVVRESCKAVV